MYAGLEITAGQRTMSESSIVRANPWMTGHVVRSFGLLKKIQF